MKIIKYMVFFCTGSLCAMEYQSIPVSPLQEKIRHAIENNDSDTVEKIIRKLQGKDLELDPRAFAIYTNQQPIDFFSLYALAKAKTKQAKNNVNACCNRSILNKFTLGSLSFIAAVLNTTYNIYIPLDSGNCLSFENVTSSIVSTGFLTLFGCKQFYDAYRNDDQELQYEKQARIKALLMNMKPGAA